jgi:hypothetical protein
MCLRFAEKSNLPEKKPAQAESLNGEAIRAFKWVGHSFTAQVRARLLYFSIQYLAFLQRLSERRAV